METTKVAELKQEREQKRKSSRGNISNFTRFFSYFGKRQTPISFQFGC